MGRKLSLVMVSVAFLAACSSQTSAPETVTVTAPPQAGSSTSAPTTSVAPVTSSATAAPAACGPDEATALKTALAKLPPDQQTGMAWNSTPLESNYDPCADLSTILVMIEKGTGSSPVQ